jgi:hypothetical protein
MQNQRTMKKTRQAAPVPYGGRTEELIQVNHHLIYYRTSVFDSLKKYI